jgi:hypothetical protein
MPRPTQTIKAIRMTKLMAGIHKHLSKEDALRFKSRAYTLGELVAVFQAELDALDQIAAARTRLTAAVAKERTLEQQARRLELAIKSFIVARFGTRADVLGDFGWEVPRKPGPKTVDAKLAGALKGAATRKARGTLGKRQRLKVRGTS